ncbi:ABC transporter substrate-binding protein [Variovorax paradoxus]|uniref:ABC transporter substrate-binding protein n=1 Tax=Variovorax paradoxus TaxID=34073 RepID=UPI0005AC7F04|nr:ABC transporter substrate-binding protein [Variovorax paradoxus]
MTTLLDIEPADSSAVRIGALVPLTRPGWVEAGQHLLAGLELAVADVNDAGGIDGRRLELIVRDTAADPQKASGAVDELAALGVVALAGEYHSVVARTAAARAEAIGLPFLCSSAVLDALTEQPSRWVARLAPPQSRGWRIYADHLLEAGHQRIAVASQPSVYWAAGIGILHDHLSQRGATLVELGSLEPLSACNELAGSEATALLLLVGYPEPAVSLVQAVRQDARLAGLWMGAPAGQPELAQWAELLGDQGAAVPFLRYLPERLSPLGQRTEVALQERLGGPPSFVAFEGYDTVAVLARMIQTCGEDRARIADAWPLVVVEGTRGTIRFSRVPGISVWQWASAPVQVADRDPADAGRFRVLRSDPGAQGDAPSALAAPRQAS